MLIPAPFLPNSHGSLSGKIACASDDAVAPQIADRGMFLREGELEGG
jgi:hypothetical protein